jgi:hypothetical protein
MKLSDISNMNKEDLLSTLGLSIKPTTSERLIGSLGLFGLGALVGAGVALLLAPSSGEDLRDGLGKRIRRFVPASGEDAASNGRMDRGPHAPEARAATTT